MFKLVIQDDEGKTTVVPLIRDEITIGRKEGNTIRLTERNVSRRHARILRNNGEVQIEDLGSYNGIRVNNARIAERVSLRVSDQVQIGDYKLYLKAEGVEQVDDARTMPIERIDSTLPTEVMPAMQPAVAQGPMPGAPQPNRSAAAIADTDPAGRPVATAAQVAALSQPIGYGKLVVISSNFAGKEFDLSRPQMIIGRTDENDIVINHRSISRNHAKVTRDPETGRYTISDLQSSNGVRVNGQDYGKVELRRGDTIDLGHVRLRFVEPGEDFVFARDAVIADVPDGSSKRGLLVAILLGVLVLGGVGAFFALRQQGGGAVVDTPDQGIAQTGNEDVAVTNPPPQQPPSDDTGSGGANAVTPEVPEPPQNAVVPPPQDIAGSIAVECKQFAVDKKWIDANNCADRLAQHDPKTAKALKAQYKQEIENDLTLGRISEAVSKNDLGRARKELALIEEDSVYRKDAVKLVEDLQAKLTARYRDEAIAIKRSGKCDGYDRLLAEARDKGGPQAYQAVLREKCVEQKDCSDRLLDNTRACKQQFCAKNPGDQRCGGGAVVVTPPANCDAEALKDEGMQNVNLGQHAAALAKFEASLKCKRDTYVLQLAFMSACSSNNPAKAKHYFKQLAPAVQQKVAQICIRQKVEYQ